MVKKYLPAGFLLLTAFHLSFAEDVRTLHFVQDDAQDYMVSKIYVLRYVQANDINPFVSGMVKRYNVNSVVNCIEYGNANEQILTVTCPVKMMPYVDDFIQKADRNIQVDGHTPGDVIKGTGITRAVYRPLYRSGQTLVNLIVNAMIGAGPYGSVYGYDANSNQIYWKDNTTNTEFIYQFLAFLDRPAPQISLTFTIYETRDAVMDDIGIDYLAWKNGPGLDLFQAGWQVFDVSSGGSAAIQAVSGPMGGFFFAPQFDASFLRILRQHGNADIHDTASMVVANSDTQSYSILFNPQLQNLIKSEQDQSSVSISSVIDSGINQIGLTVSAPIVNIHSGTEIDFEIPNYEPGQYANASGTLFFGYDIQAANAVERNNYGAELVETTQITGNALIELNREMILSSWNKEQEVEQVVGVPWLIRIPYLRYLFGTVTKSREKSKVWLTVKAEILNTTVQKEASGKLVRMK